MMVVFRPIALLASSTLAVVLRSSSEVVVVVDGFVHRHHGISFPRRNAPPSSSSSSSSSPSPSSSSSSSSPSSPSPEDEPSASYCYVPPYGMVRRSSSIVMSMMLTDDYYDDDRLRVKKQRVQDPIIQDFGSLRDWNAIKTGDSSPRMNRNGRGRAGDDDVNEKSRSGGGGGFDLLDERRRRQAPPPPPFLDGDGGGNFWFNPVDSMDRYPSPPPPMDGNGSVGGGLMMAPRRRRDVAFNRRRRNGGGRDIVDDAVDRRRRRTNAGPPGDGGGGGWWETRRGGSARDDYDLDDGDFDYDDDYDYDDDDIDDDADDGGYYRNDRKRSGGGSEYYGPPPPTRSRSSFRSGAPPPPRPVKQFYDKLFWFGFDPDATGPTDRTMFGGTRGKFNAMDLLRDREERQRRYRDYGSDYDGGGGGGMRRRRRRGGNDPVIQDFGSVRDWDARKNGRGRVGGDAVGDDVVGGGRRRPFPFPEDVVPPPPPPGMPRYDFDSGFDDDDYFLLDDGDEDVDDIVVERDGRGGRRSGGELQRRRRKDRGDGRQINRRVDPRAQEYNRFLGLGPPPDVDDNISMDDEYRRFPSSLSSRRRRKGFAYKYNDIDLSDDDGEYIDIEPLYATKGDLDMARAQSGARSSVLRRSWEERAIEMDRVPPQNAVAWGPNGPVGESPLEVAAMDALRDIKKSKKYLERKEEDVEDAKETVLSLKADASFYEIKLDGSRGRGEASKIEQELEYVLRDVEDASLKLRLARAERDAASNRVSDLEERNWALLSEFEAAKSFEEGMD